MSRKKIVIIGAGFSGTLLAVQLVNRASNPLEVVITERTGRFGRGVAYGTEEPSHLLNVQAFKMSAFPERPNDFLEWLGHNATEIAPTGKRFTRESFVPRTIYGRYLESVLNSAKSSLSNDVVFIEKADEASSIECNDGGAMVGMKGGGMCPSRSGGSGTR